MSHPLTNEEIYERALGRTAAIGTPDRSSIWYDISHGTAGAVDGLGNTLHSTEDLLKLAKYVPLILLMGIGVFVLKEVVDAI